MQREGDKGHRNSFSAVQQATWTNEVDYYVLLVYDDVCSTAAIDALPIQDVNT